MWKSQYLRWEAQHEKLKANPRFSVTEIVMQLPGDSQRRSVSCLPLRKLPGWLMTIYPNKVRPEIREDCGKLTTDSLKVAAVFGKKHKHVLAAVNRLVSQVTDSFGKPNFEPAEYEVQNNLGFMVKERMYRMTRDGFVLLAMECPELLGAPPEKTPAGAGAVLPGNRVLSRRVDLPMPGLPGAPCLQLRPGPLRRAAFHGSAR